VVNEPVVKTNSLSANPSRSFRQYPAPGNGKPMIGNIQFFDELCILFISIVKVAGCISMLLIVNLSRLLNEVVPY
jgi:hypothetical protein